MNIAIGYVDLFYAYGITIAWVLAIYLNAKGDAKIDNTGKKRRHGIEGFSEVFYVLPAGLVWLAYTGGAEISLFVILKYPLLRFGMFNLVYNANRTPQLPWDFLGTTDWFDRQLVFVRDWGKVRRIPILGFLYIIIFFTAFFVN